MRSKAGRAEADGQSEKKKRMNAVLVLKDKQVCPIFGVPSFVVRRNC